MRNTILYFFAIFLAHTAHAQTPNFPTLDPLPEALDSLPEYEVKRFARELANRALLIQALFEQQANRAILEREVLEEQLDASKADTLATDDERKAITNALKDAKKAEKDAQKLLKNAAKPVELALDVAEQDSATLRKNLPKAYKKVATLLPKPELEEAPIAEVIGPTAVSDPAESEIEEKPQDNSEPNPEPSAEAPDPGSKKKPKKQTPERPPVKTYNPAEDVMLNPPPRPCVLTVDSRDAFSGERRREVQAEELLRYTNPALKSYFTDREHIVCVAAMATNAGAYFLQLRFTINDVNAQRAFGKLPQNGVAIIKLLDGETLTLYNLRADEGKASEDKQSFTFIGQYTVDPGMFKKFQKSPLDKIRIAWGTGYEDYEVHNVDILQRQLNCIQKN